MKLEIFAIILLLILLVALFNGILYNIPKDNFEEGDIVEAFGNRGIVKSISKNKMFVNVLFDDFQCTTVMFNIDGRMTGWHKNVSLRKVRDGKAK